MSAFPRYIGVIATVFIMGSLPMGCGAGGETGDDGIGTEADGGVGAAALCSADVDCDDKLACTDDKCADTGRCQWTLQTGSCLINSVCVSDASPNSTNPCLKCDPTSPHKWTATDDGGACDDGDKCTEAGTCSKGACTSKPRTCDDDNPCTTDDCKAGEGCVSAPGPTGPCDDGNACSVDDSCTDGACIGKPKGCNDDNPCTTDSCALPVGCTHTNNDDACDDGDKCTDGDTCKAGKCDAGGPTNCDDGNACTIDMCQDFAGCGHLPTKNPCCTGKVSICDDGDPCTTDLCDAKTSKCSKKLNTAVCNDANPCTTKDTCKAGKCEGAPNKCDDKNACTKDACDGSKGCVHTTGNNGGACDDGNPCTKDDKCADGKCKGSGQCACQPKFTAIDSKLNFLEIGKGGQPGEGLNIDGDSKTCAPKSNCKDGIDNAVGALAGIANPQLGQAITDGTVMLVVELSSAKQGAVSLSIHQAELHASNTKCEHMKAHCKYSASMSLLDALTCKPKVKLSGQLTGDKFKAGGKGSMFPFTLPLQPGVNLDIKIYNVQLQGTVKMTDGKVTSFEGLLGGAVPKKSLSDAIKALPSDGLPLPKDTILGILDTTVDQDQDIDGDGTKDASSIALKVKGIGATLIDAK